MSMRDLIIMLPTETAEEISKRPEVKTELARTGDKLAGKKVKVSTGTCWRERP